LPVLLDQRARRGPALALLEGHERLIGTGAELTIHQVLVVAEQDQVSLRLGSLIGRKRLEPGFALVEIGSGRTEGRQGEKQTQENDDDAAHC